MLESISLELPVDHHSFFLIEEGQNPILGSERAVAEAGLARSAPQRANFITACNDGRVDLVVELSSTEPDARAADYEDIIELPFDSRDGIVAVHTHNVNGYLKILPPLPEGPGSYRLRYHARNMDEADQHGYGGKGVDGYLLQIWPAPWADPQVLQARSLYAKGFTGKVSSR
ncbi:hypothetical protein [Actinomadura litoris]|uniref:hypothetical protein n=1 Tax=Actinomadura litoris TaxID=2678616 RepID=UPI001FA768E0|nr:hypothetical protein [Actinomadura litoris]